MTVRSIRRTSLAAAALAVAATMGVPAAQAATGSAAQAATGSAAQVATGSTAPGPVCDPVPHPTPVHLTTADDGRVVCVVRGEQVLVTLSVDPALFPNPVNWWTPIAVTGKAVSPIPNTLLPVRGTTIGTFRAVADGTSTLSSTWNPCPPPTGGQVCGAPIRLWRVTVDVVG